MKKAEEQESTKLVKLDNMDGLWYEQPDILSKYKRRPEELELMRYTHFGKMFASGGKAGTAGPIDEEEEGDVIEEGLEESKFNYIMTESDSQGVELPEMIQLDSPMPKETPFMHRRKFPAALRFHKINKDNSPYKFFLSELMMYVPFRDENEFMYKDDKEIERIYSENFDNIKKVKGKIMKYLEDVQEARYYVEEAKKKLEIEEVGINLDEAAEQDNADCQEEELELHTDYSHMETEGIKIQEENEKQVSSIYRKIDIPNMKELKENTALLDPFQRRVIDIGIQYAK